MGFPFIILLLVPIYFISLKVFHFIFQKCKLQKAEAFMQRRLDSMVWNGILRFLAGIYILIAVSAFLNVEQDKVMTRNSNYYISLILLASVTVGLPLYIILNYCLRSKETLVDDKFKKKYGELVNSYNVEKKGKQVILHQLANLLRILSLAFALIYLRDYMQFQIILINFMSQALVTINGLTKPFTERQDNKLDQFNELLIWIFNYNYTD